MSFENALEIASQSTIQEIFTQNESFEQSFEIAGNYNADWTKVDANISSNSKQNLNSKNSESSTEFSANITSSWETTKVKWALDIKLADDTLYLNISSLDLTWNQNLAMIWMMIEWFKNQWLSVPMSWLNNSSLSIIKDSKDFNAKAKEIVINEWSVTYNWVFSEFNWYNARKISLDNDKLNELIKEYYETINKELDEEQVQEAPEIDIKNFEWYLVITWKDKVTTVIENLAIAEDDVLINVNWFAWEDFKLYLSEGENDLLSIVAQKKRSKYKISATISDSISLNGTVSPKISKSSINLKFDATLTINSENEWNSNIVIPFKGTRKYNSISDFSVTIPTNAQDLTELLWSYLGGMVWGDDYNYDEDLYWDGINELENIDTEVPEIGNNSDTTENLELTE